MTAAAAPLAGAATGLIGRSRTKIELLGDLVTPIG